jgi:formimidoylglutamate deiminase
MTDKTLGDMRGARRREGGARATGCATGALVAGMRAEWIVLDPAHAALVERPSDAWLSGVVFCEHAGDSPVRDVYVGETQVIDKRRHREEETAYAQYRAALAELLK